MSRSRVRIVSNIHDLDGQTVARRQIELLRFPKGRCSIRTMITMFLRSFGCDYFIMNFDAREFLVLAILKLMVPFHRCRLVSLDLLLTRPAGFKDRLVGWIRCLALARVYRFLVFSRDTRGYQRCFHLRPEQFVYLPYKVNALELILCTPTSEGSNIFSGGKSRRDFTTLNEAMRPLPWIARIVTVSDDLLVEHGTSVDALELASNVELVRHDGTVEKFVEWMAGSRLVVLPLLKGIITQAGIAVYLMAMALGKCVVISSGPGVDDVLCDDQAVIVPAGDPQALRAAIERVWKDDEYRHRIADAGQRYALSLGDSKSLIESVRAWVEADLTGREAEFVAARLVQAGGHPRTHDAVSAHDEQPDHRRPAERAMVEGDTDVLP